MEVAVLILLSTTVFANPVHNIRQAKEQSQRRQFGSYINNIVHENPIYPDQAAQSTVKVNLNQAELKKPIYSNPFQEFQQPFTQNYPTDAPQSQLFNVGYSVSFTNGNKQVKPQPAKYTRKQNLEDAEIITGTRKQNEEVDIPSPQDYVSAALISTKKQKIAGIKSKPQLFLEYSNPKLLLSQANLSPSTQKFYKVLEQLKPQVQNTQDLQQKYSWRNLSPGVEIIKSTEVPIAQKYTRSEPTNHFDHAKALGRSQDFDYSNAVDNNNAPQQNILFYKSQHQEKPQQIPEINQNLPRFPLDTTLLTQEIPVQVDTRFVEEARNQATFYNPKYPQNQEPVNYLQKYRTLPVEESTQHRPVQVVYRHEQPQPIEENTQYKPVQLVYRQEQPQVFQNYAPDLNNFQFKIYGKPQPVPANSNEEQDEYVKRQPRFLGDLHTNLRPPPFDYAYAYQRRIRV